MLAFAQYGYLSGMLRNRFEVQHGYRVPPDTNSVAQVIMMQRTRFNAGFQSDRWGAYISLQDVRTWGDQVLQTQKATLGLYEGWFQYHFKKNFSVKAGRQELLYDNNRIMGHTDWNMQARTVDALKLRWVPAANWQVELVGSYNQERQNLYGNYYGLANPKTLDILWINRTFKDSLRSYSWSLMILGDGWQTDDTTGVRMRWTPGTYFQYRQGKWGLVCEFYLQRGHTLAVNPKSGLLIPDSFEVVKAYMFSVNPSFALTPNLMLTLGVDWLSGSNNLDSTQRGITKLFNNQFGNNHPFYGKIDLFFNLPFDTRRGGLIDVYAQLSPRYKGWTFNAAFHYFSLNGKVEDAENPGQPLDKPLGTEIDLWVVKNITPEINLNSGFCLFFPTRSMEFVKSTQFSQLGGPPVTGYWFYFMVTFQPLFFSSKKAQQTIFD
ncbi:MAG: alginate export family protein [Chitinophagales bacterium]|nr:alginate export family protein [Chitinophagales bacterium]MDW8427520.1 alginate export family protein [Chitinophagales bacterium]